MSTQQQEKLVKIKVLRECYLPVGKDGAEELVKPSRDQQTPVIHEVPESVAKEFCDKKFDAPPKYRGFRAEDEPDTKNYFTRAVRL